MMGGAIGKGNITPAAEFNIYFDPHAFDEVLKLKGNIPLVMIPLEVTHENVATQKVFDYFKKNDQIPFARAIYNMLEHFKIMYYDNYKISFPPIHDPCTIFYILHP
jgi:inosine-uridine nucleoside N-ribohydrolase